MGGWTCDLRCNRQKLRDGAGAVKVCQDARQGSSAGIAGVDTLPVRLFARRASKVAWFFAGIVASDRTAGSRLITHA
ncbi:MAG TPA: hypothetical protein VK137_04680 [Planctomycetaceae bacterium]|nr:hypothetical protein [Planctomycetaceae bacterium]